MTVKLRLARGGSKKRPYFRIVAADERAPRDGRYIERLGTYDPLLPKDSEARVKLNAERIQHWLAHGAKPTDRVHRFLDAAGILARSPRHNPKKAEPGSKAKERLEARRQAEEEAAKAAEAPAVEAASTEEAATEAPTEEAATEAPTGEAATEAPTEETATEAPAEETAKSQVEGTASESPAEEVTPEAPSEESGDDTAKGTAAG